MNKEKLIKYLTGGDRFRDLKNGYRFDRLIFSLYAFIILVFFLFATSKLGVIIEYAKFDCHSSICENPFYLNYPACNNAWEGACVTEFVYGGFHYETDLPWYVKHWESILFGLLLVAFVLNHFLHNKGFKFNKIEVNV